MEHLIEELGCRKEYTIWFVADMDRFHEDGVPIKDEDDFVKLVELTKTNPLVQIVVQHRDVEEEGRGAAKRKVAACPTTSTKKPRVSHI